MAKRKSERHTVVEFRPVDQLKPYPNNARIHPPAQVEQIASLITELGWTMPMLVDEHDMIRAGHGREEAAKLIYGRGGSIRMANGYPVPAGMVPVIVAIGWSDAQCRAYALADNRLPELSGWDEELLRVELKDLRTDGQALGWVGFSDAALDRIIAGGPVESDEDLDDGDTEGEGAGEEGLQGSPELRGTLLERMDITIADPRNVVAKGDHYILGGRHHLLCVGVMAEWSKWTSLLTEGTIFAPYPGPFVPFGEKVKQHSLVMVQPDPYTAGHILDRYEDANGAASIVKVEA